METKTVKVRVLRAFYHDKEIQPIGKVIVLPAGKATEYKGANKIEIIPDEPSPAPHKKEPVIEAKPETQKEEGQKPEEAKESSSRKGR